MTVFRLISSALFPIALAVILYWLDKKTKFSKLSYKAKQIVCGLVFGISACLATQYGIPTHNVMLNVRCASPLIAGLLFGGPAGIISGVIGGVFRWVSVYWGIGSYTRVACTLGTVVAGFVGAACRKFLFDNKKASWIYGFFIGLTTEVFHMLLVFITHMDDIDTAFDIVKACALPMILATGVSVMLATMLISVIGKTRAGSTSGRKQITQTFSAALVLCVIIAFTITSSFTYILQNNVSENDVYSSLSGNIDDVDSDIENESEEYMLDVLSSLKYSLQNTYYDGVHTLTEIPESMSESDRDAVRALLTPYVEQYSVTNINIIDKNGVIVLSTEKQYDHFHMDKDPDGQAAEFMCLLDGEENFVQDYGPTDFDPTISRKFAGTATDSGGFIQIGYDAEHLQEAINSKIEITAKNRHIGTSGFVFIIDENNQLVSCPEGVITQEAINSNAAALSTMEDDTVINVDGGDSGSIYCMMKHADGYAIIACIPESEAHFARNISVYINIFMQIIVFVILFVLVYIMIKKIIVDNIHKINNSLAKITSGNLDTRVNVRDNEEFASLSDDINATVETLKDYIAQAETRVAKELEFAKTIQLSSLPSVFPPYPNRNDFDIYASMNTAKEVGGDFYDFYFVGETKLLILIADVSGKGVPAAMFMMTAKTMIKNLAETGIPIEEIMTQANAKLCEMNDAGMFVTVWAGIVDLSTGKMTYVSAGHNPPLIKHQNGGFEYLKGRSGMVLAGMDGIKYRPLETQLLPSDKFFLYTDGVTEATDSDNNLYGDDRLRDYLNSRENLDVADTCAGVLEDINRFVGDAPQFDDITMLMFNLNEINNYNELTLAPTIKSIPRVTEFVESWMLRTKVDERTVRKVNIIVDEIYSNIANYSGSLWARVHYTRDLNSLTLTFSDNGMEYNPLTAKSPDTTLSADEREIGGLGIMMVRKMASDVSYEYTDGKNILKITIGV